MSAQDESDPVNEIESDGRFSSGPWEGFYLEPNSPTRFGMELILTFQEGKIHGEGQDVVGPFVMSGTYEADSGRCWWSKQYLGRHKVAYQGYHEGNGIWGLWEIHAHYKGGFHIWPIGTGQGRHQSVAIDIDQPSERYVQELTLVE